MKRLLDLSESELNPLPSFPLIPNDNIALGYADIVILQKWIDHTLLFFENDIFATPFPPQSNMEHTFRQAYDRHIIDYGEYYDQYVEPEWLKYRQKQLRQYYKLSYIKRMLEKFKSNIFPTADTS